MLCVCHARFLLAANRGSRSAGRLCPAYLGFKFRPGNRLLRPRFVVFFSDPPYKLRTVIQHRVIVEECC